MYQGTIEQSKGRMELQTEQQEELRNLRMQIDRRRQKGEGAQDLLLQLRDKADPGHGSLMRHFKSKRNAVCVKVNRAEKGKSLFYFPDNNNKTAWRWPNAFVQLPDFVRHWRRFQWIHLVD